MLRRPGTKLEKNDKGSGTLITISLVISILIAYTFAASNIAILPYWAFYLGITFVIIGIIIRQWSIYVLGRFFSSTVAIQKNQKVVDNGPYRLIRHPSYTGILISLIGFGLALQSLAATLLIIIIFAVAYGYRIQVEEKTLTSELGDEYIEYSKKTKRLIPYIL